MTNYPEMSGEFEPDYMKRDATRRTRGEPEAISIAGALGIQVGGNHYKGMAIQPMEFSIANNLNACQHTAVKYIVRRKGDRETRLEDLDKAIHTLQIYKEMIEKGLAI